MSKKEKKEYKLDKATVKFEFKRTQADPLASHSCTYRFPLKDAQGFERRALAMGTTRGQLLMSLVRSFNDSTPDPKGVKPEKTAEPTIYGAADRKKAGVKLRRQPNSTKPAKEAASSKKEKPAAKKKTAEKPEAAEATSLSAVLGKMKRVA